MSTTRIFSCFSSRLRLWSPEANRRWRKISSSWICSPMYVPTCWHSFGLSAESPVQIFPKFWIKKNRKLRAKTCEFCARVHHDNSKCVLFCEYFLHRCTMRYIAQRYTWTAWCCCQCCCGRKVMGQFVCAQRIRWTLHSSIQTISLTWTTFWHCSMASVHFSCWQTLLCSCKPTRHGEFWSYERDNHITNW